MSNLYANTGVDLDLILYQGTGAQTTGIIDDTGQDLGNRYSSGSVGYDLGFVAQSGQDIGRILGGEVAAVWRSRGTDVVWSSSADSVVSTAWHYVTMFKNTSSDWNKITSDTDTVIVGNNWGTNKGQKFALPCPQGWSAYAFRVVLNQTSASIDVALGTISYTTTFDYDSRWTDPGQIHLSELRHPNSYTTTFVLYGKNGYGNVHAGDEWYDDGSEFSYGYFPYYDQTFSTVPLIITLKNNGIATRTYRATVKF